MMSRRSNCWFEILLIVLTVLSHLYIVLSPAKTFMNWYGSDDAFYYYKVAENVVNGQGVTFDGINHTNGFQPAWMVVCISLFWLIKSDQFLPLRLLVMISALLNAGAGIILFRLLSKFISPINAGLVSIVWIFLPSIQGIVSQNGMETSLTAFSLSLVFYLIVKWQNEHLSPIKAISLGLIAGLAVLSRLDNIFVILLLGVWFVFSNAGPYLRTILVGDLAVLFYGGLLSNYFGARQGFIPDASGYLPWIIVTSFIVTPLVFFGCGLYTNRVSLSRRFISKFALAFALTLGLIFIMLVLLQSLGVSINISGRVLLLDLGIVFTSILFLRIIAWWLFCREGHQNDMLPQPIHWAFLKGVLIRSLGYIIPILLLLGVYSLWSYLYTGSPLPVSGQIKMWWGTLGITAYGLPVTGFSELFGNSAWSLALSPIHFVSILLGSQSSRLVPVMLKVILLGLLLLVLLSQRKFVTNLLDKMGLIAIFAGLYAQILSYTSTGYLHTREWYWVGEMFFTMICVGILLQCLSHIFSKNKIGLRIWSGVIILMVIGSLYSFSNMLVSEFPYQPASGYYDAYLEECHALETVTEPGAIIGMTGGGATAYFIHDRTIINLDGLINSPAYFFLLRSGQGSSFLDEMKVGYVYGSEFMLTKSDPYREMLSDHIIPLTRLDNNVLYRYGSNP